MSTELIIFDCDGTLVDSEPLCNRAFSEILSNYGCDIAPEECTRRFTGLNLADCMGAAEEESGVSLPDSFVDEFRARMNQLFTAQLKPMPGAVVLLESLTIPYCIASNGPHEKMRESLEITKLAPLFQDRVFSAYDIGAWKPDPEIFLHAAEHFDIPPENCLVVEDSGHGLHAAVAARMEAIAFAPEGPQDDWPKAIACYENLTEIHDLLIQRNLAEKKS